jgi:hypothetical protein
MSVQLDGATNRYVDDDGTSYPRVSTVLETAGLRRPLWMIHPDRLEQRAWLGEEAHLATHYLDEGALDWESVPDEAQPLVWGWERFKREHAYEVTEIECIVVSRRHRYAGTFDRLGWRTTARGRRRSLVDLKIGIPNGAEYATAAYVCAHREGHPHDTPLIERLCVQLLPGDYRLHGPYDDRNNLAIFLCAVALYHERHNKGLLSPPRAEELTHEE